MIAKKTRTESVIDRICMRLDPVPTAVAPRLEPIQGVRAVLFDIYGTLLISDSGDVGTAMEQNRSEALAEALSAVGIADGKVRIGAHDLIGDIKRRQALAREQGVASPEVDIRTVWGDLLAGAGLRADRISTDLIERLGLEYECRVNSVWPMPNGSDCIERLRSVGMELGIVSNAQYYTPLLMERLLPGFPTDLGFDPRLIVYSYELLQSKPDTIIFERPLAVLAEDYGISPDETVYVGNDMLNDVWAAKQLGLHTILFAGDQRSLRLREADERCRGFRPDAVVTDLAQIESIIR